MVFRISGIPVGKTSILVFDDLTIHMDMYFELEIDAVTLNDLRDLPSVPNVQFTFKLALARSPLTKDEMSNLDFRVNRVSVNPGQIIVEQLPDCRIKLRVHCGKSMFRTGSNSIRVLFKVNRTDHVWKPTKPFNLPASYLMRDFLSTDFGMESACVEFEGYFKEPKYRLEDHAQNHTFYFGYAGLKHEIEFAQGQGGLPPTSLTKRNAITPGSELYIELASRNPYDPLRMSLFGILAGIIIAILLKLLVFR